MLDQAKLELSAPDSSGHQVGHFYQTSMEKHTPEEKYDLVVIQWAAIYLTDDDFVKVFKQYKESLTENGYIFFKENCSSQESFLVDCDDSSLTRSDKHYKQLFERAGVRVVKEAFQKDWPNNLMKVKMYGLK
ncbi:hypothetical protein AGDE_06094 [Angomonas deanei]|nr:hypothetical protein AGDE_06094 [Angomonas deanei]|eukprot:EPY37839.1 hypothetical protein AGDE_06094 [Angomonas deanei]